MVKLNRCVFRLKILFKNMKMFGIKSAVVLKKNLIANPSAIKHFLKPK